MNCCCVCKNTTFTTLHNGKLKKCTTCGFTTANLDAGNQIPAGTYSAEYFKGGEYEDYVRDKKILQYNFQKRIEAISGKVPKSYFSNILEIGCAYGFFGELASARWGSAYTGIDIVAEATTYASTQLSVNANCEDYLTFRRPPEPYTSIFMWDVIEHLPHPDEYLAKASEELMANGYLFITTGDIGSLLARIQGKHWRMLYTPTHVHYFSKKTLISLLAAHHFNVIDISYPAIARSMKQIFYSLFLLKKSAINRITASVYNRIPDTWQVNINTRDIMFVTAQKKISN